MTHSKCPTCNRKTDIIHNLCKTCEKYLKIKISQLADYVRDATNHLQPAKTGKGTNNGETSIGININALDWATGKPVLDILWEWEKLIREERQLTPPALLPPAKDEIATTIAFHQAHLEWTLQQPWITDYHNEIIQLHKEGQLATRSQPEPVRRISCPSPTETDTTCNKLLAIEKGNMDANILCPRCKTNWTPARLVAVALSDPNHDIWLDAESIGEWVNLSERHVRRQARQWGIHKRGSLLNFTQYINQKRNLDLT